MCGVETAVGFGQTCNSCYLQVVIILNSSVKTTPAAVSTCIHYDTILHVDSLAYVCLHSFLYVYLSRALCLASGVSA